MRQPIDGLPLELRKLRPRLLLLNKFQQRILDRGANAAQGFHHRQAAERHVGFGVAALVHHHQFPAAQTIRRLLHQPGHRPEAVAVQLHPRQRVHGVGIIAAGNDNQLRLKARQRRNNDGFQRIAPAVVPRPGQQRNIDVVTFARARAAIVLTGITGWEATVLMQGDSQHVVALQVDMLGAVAVMNVPVNDRHLAEPQQRFRPLDGNRNIGEETEAHRLVRQAVVSGRSRQRIGIIQLALQHRFHRRAGQAGGETGDFITARPQRRLFAQHAAAVIAYRLEALKIAVGMDPPQVRKACRRRAAQRQLRRQPGDVHQVFHPPFGLRRFGMTAAGGRLHPPAHRQRHRVQTGTVPETTFIKEETGFSFHSILPLAKPCRRPTPPQSKSVTAARSPLPPAAADRRWQNAAVKPRLMPDRPPCRRRSPD